MTITRRPPLMQDFPLGTVEVNASIDNNSDMLDSWNLRHSVAKGNYTQPNALKSFGRHTDQLLARTVASFQVDTSTSSPVLVSSVSGPAIVRSLRLGVGEWQIDVTGVASMAAIATLAAANATTTTPVAGKAEVYPFGTAGNTTSLYVLTVLLSGTDFVATDYGFSLTIWGKVV